MFLNYLSIDGYNVGQEACFSFCLQDSTCLRGDVDNIDTSDVSVGAEGAEGTEVAIEF